MPIPDPILIFARPLNEYRIPYMITGSSACIAYGEPRLTNDIDFVIELTALSIPLIVRAFPEQQFYCPPQDVLLIESRRATHGHFNLIDTDTGLKADCYLSGADPLHRWGFERRRSMEIDGVPVMFAPPEYVIVRKLEYFRDGGSTKHLQDIAGMINVSDATIDRPTLLRLIGERQLDSQWKQVHSDSMGT